MDKTSNGMYWKVCENELGSQQCMLLRSSGLCPYADRNPSDCEVHSGFWWSPHSLLAHQNRGYLASGNSGVKGSYLSTCTPQEAKHQGKLVELLINTCQPLSQGRTRQMRGGIRGSHISSEVWGQKSVLASFLCNFRHVEWSWLTHLIWCVTFFFCITSLVDSVLVLLLWSPLSLTVFSITT